MKRSLQRIYWFGIAITLVMAAITVFVLVTFRIMDMRESLRSVLETVSAWTLADDGDLQSQAERIAAVSQPARVTFLMNTGIVLADSQEDALRMANHQNRPEVQKALRSDDGVGESIRFSQTQGTFMLYGAKRIAPNLILRMSYPAEMITSALMLYGFGVVMLFIVLIAFQRRHIARFMKLLARQMDDMRRILEGAETGGKAVFPELQPAIDNIAYRAQRLNSDLEEVNRTLSLRNEFVAHASHELRSPLTSIMGFAEMLDEGLADTPEEQEICIKTIRGECQRMLDVVEDVLLLSRAENEKNLTVTAVDVGRVAQEICQALAPQAAPKGIELIVEGALERQAVEKDIWEILHNLTSNAIRYGKQDGHVWIRLDKDSIQVEDDGIGIAAEHLPHIFEQFYRVDETRDPSVRGTGLGLSIVRTLAGRNGGSMNVASQPGAGSCFTVQFGKEGATP